MCRNLHDNSGRLRLIRFNDSPMLRAWFLTTTLFLLGAFTNFAFARFSDQAESIESYLDRHNLSDLVIIYLEEDLNQTLGGERIQIAERLAVLYGRAFDAAGTISEREMWAKKSNNLIEKVPEVDTPILRLNLAKAKYLRAEAVAEQYRLRAVDHNEMLIAQRMMSEAGASFVDEFRSLRSQIRRLETLNVDKGDPNRSSEAARQLDELDKMASQASYFAGWSRYYEGWLSDDQSKLTEALTMFGWVLEGHGTEPSLEEMPASLLSFEHVARSTLGVALSLAALGKTTSALDWIDTLRAEQTNESVKKQYPAYRLEILFDRADQDIEKNITPNWADLRKQVDEMRKRNRLTPTLARLLAVRALQAAENSGGDPVARQLAGLAIAELSQESQLAQVLEIAEQFNLDVLGKNSFAIAYVLALKTHERARQAHGSDEPTTEPSIIRLYNESQKQLRQAASRRDAEDFPGAASHAMLLAAWAQYFSSDFSDAAQAFLKVSSQLDRDDRETAFWMRIVSLDRWRQKEKDPQARSRLITALREYLDEFPSSNRSGRIRYQLTILEGGPATPQRVETLLEIPPNSDAYEFAQRAAEQMLYTLFRQAPGMQRVELGRRYLSVAMPLAQDSGRRVISGRSSADLKSLYVTWSRRTLEILLSRGISRILDARVMLDRLQTANSSGLLDLSEYEEELTYRRFQILLLGGRYDDATKLCDEIWNNDPGGIFTSAAMRELISRDLQDYHAFPNDAGSTEALRRVLTYGERLLNTIKGEPDLKKLEALMLVAAVAEASHALEKRGIETEKLHARALTLYASLLQAQPSNYPFLKANAELAEEDSNYDAALAHWREALTRLNGRDLRWFEAKYNLIRDLLRVDPERAKEVMEQHELLNPSYGPSPWGERLADLAEQLKKQPTQANPQNDQPETEDDHHG